MQEQPEFVQHSRILLTRVEEHGEEHGVKEHADEVAMELTKWRGGTVLEVMGICPASVGENATVLRTCSGVAERRLLVGV
jgi:hypothetical protein